MGEWALLCPFLKIRPVLFPSDCTKDATCGRQNGWKLFIFRRSWHLSFVKNMIILHFPFSILTWRLNNFVFLQGKRIHRRNKSTVFTILCVVKKRVFTHCISVNCRSNLFFSKNRKNLSCQEFISKRKINCLFTTVELFLSSKVTATLRNKRKLAAVSRETQESARHSLSQNTFVPGETEEYNTQVSEEIDSKVTKKLSHELIRTESSVLGALSKLDKFLPNPQVRTSFRTVAGTSRYSNLWNGEPTRKRSQKKPHPKVEFPTWWTSNSADSDQEDTPHIPPVVRNEVPEKFLFHSWLLNKGQF